MRMLLSVKVSGFYPTSVLLQSVIEFFAGLGARHRSAIFAIASFFVAPAVSGQILMSGSFAYQDNLGRTVSFGVT